MKSMPRYPIYIPSKGRADKLFTAKMFDADAVPYKVVVEPNEVAAYEPKHGPNLLVLPENGMGLVYSRNWIKDYSRGRGEARHWQFDDDIQYMSRTFRGYRIRCESNVALAIAEDFADRYENVALTSFNSEFFIPTARGTCRIKIPPFYLNSRCYTCFLIENSLPNRWRQRYNEDTDMTLQVLAAGWCTVLLNAFTIKTVTTMSVGGGQTPIYVNDGRLKMSRQLERVWRGVVTTKRRFGRPQHHVADNWKKFDTPLRLRPGVKIEEGTNDYGLELAQVADSVRSARLAELLETTRGERAAGRGAD